MSEEGERLERLLGAPGLRTLRQRLRRRFEQGRSADVFTLAAVSEDERRALDGLLGNRSRLSGSITLSVAKLDAALVRAGLARSLREALERLDGPIENIALDRSQRETEWAAVFLKFDRPPLQRLLLESAGRGLVRRLSASDPAKGETLLSAASTVLGRLPARGVPLSHLAADTLRDAHALDEGRPVATLVMSVLASESDERARDTWAKNGVLVAELAWPALSLNVPARESGSTGRLVVRANENGEPIHLSLRMLLRSQPEWLVQRRTVFVCENPSVVAMASDVFGPRCEPIVCTDGMPSAAQRTLLSQLAAAGADLRYHGDYDWPGIAIGNFVMRTFGAKPWRFGADHYFPTEGRALEGAPVRAAWDASLTLKMKSNGIAIDEEAFVDTLLNDLLAQHV